MNEIKKRGEGMPYGVVKEVGKRYAIVQMERQEMCGECHACDYITGKKDCILRCEKEIECQVGDMVELKLAQPTFLKATYVMYGFPLIGLIIGLVIGLGASKLFRLGSEDLWVLIGGLLGIVLPLIGIKWAENQGKFKKYLPYIIAKREI